MARIANITSNITPNPPPTPKSKSAKESGTNNIKSETKPNRNSNNIDSKRRSFGTAALADNNSLSSNQSSNQSDSNQTNSKIYTPKPPTQYAETIQCTPLCQYFPDMSCLEGEWIFSEAKNYKVRQKEKVYRCQYDNNPIEWYRICPREGGAKVKQKCKIQVQNITRDPVTEESPTILPQKSALETTTQEITAQEIVTQEIIAQETTAQEVIAQEPQGPMIQPIPTLISTTVPQPQNQIQQE